MTPKWAMELMAQVLKDEEWNQPVSLTWRRAGPQRHWVLVNPQYKGARAGYRKLPTGERRESSSGRAWPGRIVITAGTSRLDQKLVLLHELAHVLNNHHHGPAFWDKAWELFRRYGIPVRYAQKREYAYREGARSAYIRTRRMATGR